MWHESRGENSHRGGCEFLFSSPWLKTANATKRDGKLGFEDVDISLVNCSVSIICDKVLGRSVGRDICR